MAAPTLGTYLRGLRQAMAAEALAGCPDRDLVNRLRAGPDEAAFRAVLDRHGPMVYRVCRRVLDTQADVEDAFQAPLPRPGPTWAFDPPPVIARELAPRVAHRIALGSGPRPVAAGAERTVRPA